MHTRICMQKRSEEREGGVERSNGEWERESCSAHINSIYTQLACGIENKYLSIAERHKEVHVIISI